MPTFVSKQVEIEAEQYLPDAPTPTGVCFGRPDPPCSFNGLQLDGLAHLHTMHNSQCVRIVHGDWVVPEPDGVHYYPIKDHVFQSKYDPVEPAPEPTT